MKATLHPIIFTCWYKIIIVIITTIIIITNYRKSIFLQRQRSGRWSRKQHQAVISFCKKQKFLKIAFG